MSSLALLVVRVEVSKRYGVLGVYKDRDRKVIRIYPLPFVRVTVNA